MNGDVFRLEGQLALVSGGGTGLGFGICQALVEAGARVVMTGRREEALAAYAKAVKINPELRDQYGRLAPYLDRPAQP